MNTSPPDPAAIRRMRRQYVVNPRFQWKYVTIGSGVVFGVSVLMGLVVYFIQFRESQARILSPAWSHAQENTALIVLTSLGFAVVMSVVFGIWSIFVTHRICGPLYVVGRCFDELIAGRFPRYRPLRKKDEFDTLYDHLWQVVDALKARKQIELDALTDILSIARRVTNGDRDASIVDLNAVAARLEVICNDYARSLSLDTDEISGPPEADSPMYNLAKGP